MYLRALLLSVGLMGSMNMAHAGDAAELNVLGFSNDGAIFAFEEFGIQDGSGFPYANRFYINTATDTYVAGTPIRVRIDREEATTTDVRAQAAAVGQKIVSDVELADHKGYTAASRAITQESADAREFLFNPRPIFPPIDQRIGFRLETLDLPPPAGCSADQPPKGFRLLKLAPDKLSNTHIVHEDKNIPASRNCPTDYRLGSVQTMFKPDGKGYYAVLISVVGMGFEGPDHRWLAVAGAL